MFREKYIPDDFHFCLGGGTYFPLNDHVDFFCKIISSIRGSGVRNPIWVEMIPPPPSEIKKMIDAGATSFGFNVEVVSDEQRQKYCPGKYKIASLQQYVNAFKTVSVALGADKTGSCILVGLDSLDGLKRSVDLLVEQGAFPCVLPVKEFDGANINLDGKTQECLERHFLLISQYAADRVRDHRINVQRNEGCSQCPCCTIIHDMLK